MAMMFMVSVFSVSVFAQPQVPKEALEAFNRNFPRASYVQWDRKGVLHMVSFVQENDKVTAYFDDKGELLKYTRYIESRNLPLTVQQAMNQAYDLSNKDRTVMEVTQGDGSTTYLISFEHKGRNYIVQSDASGVLTVIKKEKL